MASEQIPFWAVVPAAGSARRMGPSVVPKQYLPLADKTVIEHAIAPLLARSDCRGVVVVIAADDKRWSELPVSKNPRVSLAIGGAERSASVRAGLDALSAKAREDDWVLVHDAARPCLDASDLDALLAALRDDPVGGLLAAPVVDTLKRSDAADRVESTVDRAALWRALTPQMFRFAVLRRALNASSGVANTDDSQAVESLGLQPKLVRGSSDNIKITMAEDLPRAASILAARSV